MNNETLKKGIALSEKIKDLKKKISQCETDIKTISTYGEDKLNGLYVDVTISRRNGDKGGTTTVVRDTMYYCEEKNAIDNLFKDRLAGYKKLLSECITEFESL